jgi:hypothetical protein
MLVGEGEYMIAMARAKCGALDCAEKNRQQQRLVGRGYSLPLIAKCAMNGAPFGLRVVEESGEAKAKYRGPFDCAARKRL